MRNVHILLRKALADAERLALVVRNAAAAAKPAVPPKREQTTWSAEELAQFLASLAGERLVAAFVLLATTGMRRGEALGLRWSNVDLGAGRLSIVQAVTTVRDKMVITPPKTARSRRSVSLDPDTVARRCGTTGTGTRSASEPASCGPPTATSCSRPLPRPQPSAGSGGCLCRRAARVAAADHARGGSPAGVVATAGAG